MSDGNLLKPSIILKKEIINVMYDFNVKETIS